MAIITDWQPTRREGRLPREETSILFVLFPETDSTISFSVRKDRAMELAEIMDEAIIRPHQIFISNGPNFSTPPQIEAARARRREARGG
jgi:hypothetical protein